MQIKRWQDIQRACAQKVKYASEDHALQSVVGLKKSRAFRAYPCRHCGGWHLTSKKDRID